MQSNTDIGPASGMDAPTALVVEDEVLLRITLSEHLRDAGFHVLEAANGEEARTIIASVNDIGLLITDVHMTAKFEGIDLALWMTQHHPEIPVIITSGSLDVARSPALAECWNAVFVPKPYSEREMERLARVRLSARGAKSK